MALIEAYLPPRKDGQRASFVASGNDVRVRHGPIDDLPPTEAARNRGRVPRRGGMRLIDSFREKRFASKVFDLFVPPLGNVTFAFQMQPQIVRAVDVYESPPR